MTVLTWDQPTTQEPPPPAKPKWSLTFAPSAAPAPVEPLAPGGKILLNTGPSPRGVHRLELALKCPQLYAYSHVLGFDLGDRRALVRGSLGHVGLAHYYARLKAAQDGTDPEAFYEEHEAIDRAAPAFGGLGLEMQPIAHRAVDGYLANFAAERFRVLAVEHLVETRVMGHLLTARWDLVAEDAAGKIWIYDHKFVGRADSGTAKRYTTAIQFLAIQHMGREVYRERFGGVRINLVGCENQTFWRESPEAAPHLLTEFPQIIDDAEAVIERMKVRDPWRYQKTASEQVCRGPYGVCDGRELCRWGSRV